MVEGEHLDRPFEGQALAIAEVISHVDMLGTFPSLMYFTYSLIIYIRVLQIKINSIEKDSP
jgi:hypothetical protein